MAKAENCFNLVGDGDDVDVIQTTEKVFGIGISSAEASRCETFGQFFEVVSSKLNTTGVPTRGCPTALAFFRVRATLRHLGHTQRLTPQTDMRKVFNAYGSERLQRDLSRELDLSLPGLELRPASMAVLIIVLAPGAAAAIWLWSWQPLLSGLALPAALALVMPRQLPHHFATLGSYARHCSIWTYGKLARASGRARPQDIWDTLFIVIRDTAPSDFKGPVK